MGILDMLLGKPSKDLENFLSKNPVLLDVRTDSEYRSNNITGSTHIPLQELEFRAKEIKRLNRPVVVFCASGMRSENATRFLKQLGLEVMNGGGINAVRQALK